MLYLRKRWLILAILLHALFRISHAEVSKPVLALPAPKDDCKSFFKILAQKADRYLASPAEWKITPETEKAIEDVWNDSSLIRREKLRKTSDLLLKDRERGMNPLSAFFFRGALRSAAKQNSIYNYTLGKLLSFMGPHYNPVFNRVNIAKQVGDDGIREILIRMHELEHAHHRNSWPIHWYFGVKARIFELLNFAIIRPPATPFFITWSEGRAIGSQWELVQKIPKAIRKQYVEELEQHTKDLAKRATTLDPFEAEFLADIVLSGKHKDYLKAFKDLEGAKKNALPQRPEPPKPPNIVWGPSYLNLERPRYLDLENVGVGDVKEVKNNKQKKLLRSFFENEMKAWLANRDIYTEKNLKFNSELLGDLNELKEHFLYYVPRPTINYLENMTTEIALQSLKNADLPKDEFVRALQGVHGYSFEKLFKSHVFEFGAYKKFLIFSSAPIIFLALIEPEKSKDTIENFNIIDLKVLLKLYASFRGVSFNYPDFTRFKALKKTQTWTNVKSFIQNNAEVNQFYDEVFFKLQKNESLNVPEAVAKYIETHPDAVRQLIADSNKIKNDLSMVSIWPIENDINSTKLTKKDSEDYSIILKAAILDLLHQKSRSFELQELDNLQ
jgi:hypothetical protein